MATGSDLSFYGSTPFSANNEVDLVDTLISSATATYTTSNKTITQYGATIQAGNTLYWQYNGGFTTAAPNQFTLATTPPVGTQIVVPGVNQITAAAFDQDVVLGVSNPRTSAVPVWLIDHTTINNNKYTPLPTYPGIQISIVQLISGSTAQPYWFKMASADASGNSMTFGATGAPLYLPNISTFGVLACSVTAGATTLTMTSSSGWLPGMYVTANLGGGTSEDLHVIATSGSNLIIDPTGTTYSHTSGELVYHIGWKFWLELTIPTNANNNQAVNVYSLGIQRLGAIAARP